MCTNCGVNANCRTTTALTWAIPVDVVKLGASLQAYHSLKPIITYFRLCNRFGQGPNVFLTRLPQELVDMVVEYIIIPMRRFEEVEWNKMKVCAESRCAQRDHYTAEEIEAFEDLARREMDYEDPSYDTDSVVDSYVNEMVSEMDATYDTCEARKSAWETLTCVLKQFAELDKILGSEFGLSSHIAHQSITKPLVRLYYPDVNENRESVITQAYLTLPCPAFTNILRAHEICSREYIDYYDCEGKLSFFNIVDPTSLQITKEKIQRFRQAMRFLGLSPSFNEVQIMSLDHGHPDPVLAKHKKVLESTANNHKGLEKLRADVRKRLDEQEKSEWPKLMNLVKVSYELSAW